MVKMLLLCMREQRIIFAGTERRGKKGGKTEEESCAPLLILTEWMPRGEVNLLLCFCCWPVISYAQDISSLMLSAQRTEKWAIISLLLVLRFSIFTYSDFFIPPSYLCLLLETYPCHPRGHRCILYPQWSLHLPAASPPKSGPVTNTTCLVFLCLCP